MKKFFSEQLTMTIFYKDAIYRLPLIDTSMKNLEIQYLASGNEIWIGYLQDATPRI